jgi:hypothetical protein
MKGLEFIYYVTAGSIILAMLLQMIDSGFNGDKAMAIGACVSGVLLCRAYFTKEQKPKLG